MYVCVFILFVLMYAILIIKTFDINKTLNKEFKRYEKYLRLKRISRYHGKNWNINSNNKKIFMENVDLKEICHKKIHYYLY